MCGVLAMVGDHFADDFDDALDALTSRGPDERGRWSADGIHLGHRRLSIIDLSAGQQPMHSLCKRYTLAYNGEIYNFPQLREELQSQGIRFHTHSDTQVLLEACVHWGLEKTLPRLDGMFAFALWDNEKKQLHLARDRFGIKPLMFAQQDGSLVVASTLKPFFKLKRLARHINYEALREVLACQSIPSPMTMLREVSSLPPASWLTYDAQTRQTQTGRFWEIPHPIASPLSLEELVDATDRALSESVRRQLVSDVPLGAFLSGGIDSSLMVHYMASASRKPVQTFSVRFNAKDGYDESAYARQVAKQFGCEHHEFDADQLTGEGFVHAIAQLDQPLADPAYLPLLHLAHLTRQQVTVAISGDGGDELFAGYGRFFQTPADAPPTLGKTILRQLIDARLLPASLLRRSLSGNDKLLWDRVTLGPFPRTRKSLRPLLSSDAYHACHPQQTMTSWLDLASRFANPIDTDALTRADLWTYLSENCLVKTDRATMVHSLEARVPILGNPVVDLILPHRATLKIAHGPKTILTGLAQKHLPRDVWDRPKHGFSVPLHDYFHNSWQTACQELVNDADHIAPFLNAAHVRSLWQSPRTSTRSLYTVLTLLAWCRDHPMDL